MTIDTAKEKWSVWTAFVKFESDRGGKNRPVIILDDRTILCVCMGVTSKKKDPSYGYKLKNWRFAGLTRESWVRFEYLKVEPNDFENRLGMLHEDDIRGIEAWMKKLMYGHDF